MRFFAKCYFSVKGKGSASFFDLKIAISSWRTNLDPLPNFLGCPDREAPKAKFSGALLVASVLLSF